MENIKGNDIAAYLNLKLQGESLLITRPSDIFDCGYGSIVFIKKNDISMAEMVNKSRPSLVICNEKMSNFIKVPMILSDNPKRDFVKVLNKYFKKPVNFKIHKTSIIEEGALVGNEVAIGAYVRIGAEVEIGDKCEIGSGVSIQGKVKLGNNCKIKPNAVIGEEGFGFIMDGEKEPLHFPHFGSVIIGNNVFIGSCSTVELGALGATVISDGCKIDDLVQIGHNCKVDKNTLIMANTVLCGGSIIGQGCWIAPNSVIKEKIQVGDGAIIGLGSVVLKNVSAGLVVAGVPAKKIQS